VLVSGFQSSRLGKAIIGQPCGEEEKLLLSWAKARNTEFAKRLIAEAGRA
jgi:hypothetical protein